MLIDFINANIKIFVLINEIGRNNFAGSNANKMNGQIITWYIGISLLLVATLMIIASLIALYTPGDESLVPLLLSAFLTGTVGFYPLIFVRKRQHKLNFREGNCIVVGAWVLACIFGSFPYLFYGGEFTPVNAIFESVSARTPVLAYLNSVGRRCRNCYLVFHAYGPIGQIRPFRLRNFHGGTGFHRGREKRSFRKPDA